MEWIRAANLKMYDIITAFNDVTVIDWTKSGFGIKTGDIVYIYVGAPYSRIMYKTICINDAVVGDEIIDDKKYWANSEEFDDSTEHVRLELVSNITSDKLALSNLTELKLIKNRIQGAYKSENYKELFEYIHKNENMSTEDMVELFEKTELLNAQKRADEAEVLRKKFIKDFSADKLLDMSLNDYLLSPKGYGNEASFCRRIRYELEGLAHMGNAFPDVFGLYMKSGKSIELSPTLKKKFGNDIHAAFDSIKKQIIELLENVEKKDYEAISKCKLNSLFKFKLLLVYYPDQFIPVCAKGTLDAYCDVVGVQVKNNEDMIYRNIALLEWKNMYSPFAQWSNSVFMLFVDWIWRAKKKIDTSGLKKSHGTDAEKIENELEALCVEGEDKLALVKVRINQGEFRKRLLKKYSKCCLCNVNNPALLIASHIKPWSQSEPEEKLDEDNGFLMCPNHDQLFDKGWISFDDEGKIIISDQLDDVNRIYTNVNEDMKIQLTEGNKKYLNFHREFYSVKV